MKQLLIVNSAKALNYNSATPLDLSVLDKGAITFFELGAATALAAPATKNFGIALGLGNNSPAFVIPEVDIDTLTITKTLPKLGKACSKTFTFPTPVAGKEYSIAFLKKDAQINERNRFVVGIVANSTTTNDQATALRNAVNNSNVPFTASGSSSTVTVTCDTVGAMWEVQLIDSLQGVSFSSSQAAEPTIGDKAYIQDLASRCAGGKGFNYLADDGKDIYPGYPEAVEDVTPNTSGDQGASTAGYAVFNLHFATGRKAAKPTDTPIWQDVHIAIPITGSAYSDINTILPEGDYTKAANVTSMSATTSAPGSGFLTKTVADTLYDPKT